MLLRNEGACAGDGHRDLEREEVEGGEGRGTGHNHLSRSNQLLLGDWTHLSPGDLVRIRARIEEVAVRPTTINRELEACLMACVMLTTGRRFSDLWPLGAYSTADYSFRCRWKPGLFFIDGRFGWWLPAGGGVAQTITDPADMVATSNHVWLPVSGQTDALIRRVCNRRGVNPNTPTYRLFTTPEKALRQAVLRLLRADEDEAFVRRSARTVEALERWLYRELVHVPGGDPAVAALVTGRNHRVGRAMVYYGAKRMADVVDVHRQGIRKFDTAMDRCPAEIADDYLGDRNTPTDKAVIAMTGAIRNALTAPGLSLAETHRLMTIQTVTLLAFALAHRGTFNMPGLAALDRSDGFITFADKRIKGSTPQRHVWACTLVIKQLEAFEAHLDVVTASLPDPAAEELVELRRKAGQNLPLASISEKGRVKERCLQSVLRDARNLGWRGKGNAGRHWLRGKLWGRCSSETLAALFGHAQAGADPWSETSGFDPLLYAADLKRSLEPALKGVGWTVLKGWQA